MASAEASGVSASSFSTTRTVSASGGENSQSPGGMDARNAACTNEAWPVPIVVDRLMTGCHDTVVTHGDTDSDGAAFMTAMTTVTAGRPSGDLCRRLAFFEAKWSAMWLR